MNTPTHVIVNLLALGRTRASFAPAMIGAILPDVPMFGFYLWQRFIGTPERVIWSSTYFEPGWQAFFDVFNSLPLLALGLLIAWRLGASAWIVLFASMMLHCAFDLPLHNEDAHRHFYPFSDWRFASPVSYWDPRRYGTLVAPLELACLAVGAVILWRRHRWRAARIAIAGIAAVTALFVGFALWTWA